MPVTLILRSTKGTPLTNTEMDNNLANIKSAVEALETNLSSTTSLLNSNIASATSLSSLSTTLDGTYVRVAGGTMTGLLTLSGNPTTANHAATKGYVDTKAPLASPQLTGIPRAPTAPPSTNSTQIATTEYTDAAVAVGVASAISSSKFTAVKFVTSGTWVAPSGVTSIVVTAQGGGGSGGGYYQVTDGDTSTLMPGAGGSSGVGILKQQYTVTPGASYTISIGSGGAAVPGSSSSNGNNGQPTTMLGPGVSLTLGGGFGGTAGIDSFQHTSSAGPYSTPGLGVWNSALGGSGGAGMFGGAGRGGYFSAGQAAPSNSGGGGGGTGINNQPSGAGGSGFLIIEY